MADTNPDPTGNILLDTMSPEHRDRLIGIGERIRMHREMGMVTPDTPIEHVYFPVGAIASITSFSNENGRTEIGIFGREGFSGTAVLLGSDRSPHEYFVQVAGSHGWKIPVDGFLAAVEESAAIRLVMLRYVQTLMVQTAQSSVANARYQIEARLARWLLMCHDRNDGDEIALTHEFMAIMIGAQRSGVTVALHVLEGTGTIRSKRGRVIILDRGRLEELAGDSYGPAESEYRRLIAPFGKVPADD